MRYKIPTLPYLSALMLLVPFLACPANSLAQSSPVAAPVVLIHHSPHHGDNKPTVVACEVESSPVNQLALLVSHRAKRASWFQKKSEWDGLFVRTSQVLYQPILTNQAGVSCINGQVFDLRRTKISQANKIWTVEFWGVDKKSGLPLLFWKGTKANPPNPVNTHNDVDGVYKDSLDQTERVKCLSELFIITLEPLSERDTGYAHPNSVATCVEDCCQSLVVDQSSWSDLDTTVSSCTNSPKSNVGYQWYGIFDYSGGGTDIWSDQDDDSYNLLITNSPTPGYGVVVGDTFCTLTLTPGSVWTLKIMNAAAGSPKAIWVGTNSSSPDGSGVYQQNTSGTTGCADGPSQIYLDDND